MSEVFMPKLVNFLNWRLDHLAEKCTDWCQQEGLEFSLPARLAHFIVYFGKICRVNVCRCWSCTHDCMVPPNAQGFPNILPQPSESPDLWRQFLQWRLPRVNLNLLQLAIVFQCSDCIAYLWHPDFQAEQNYRDGSSRLVNHPLHLLWSLHRRFPIHILISYDYVREELFSEEGLLDLTTATIGDRTSGARQTEPAPAPQSQHTLSPAPSADLETESQNPLKSVMIRHQFHHLAEEIAAFSEPCPARILPLGDFSTRRFLTVLLEPIIFKIRGPQARQETVELLWTLTSSFGSQQRTLDIGSRETFCYEFLGIEAAQEALILLFQLMWALEEKERESRLLLKLTANNLAEATEDGIPLMKAAKYLTQKQILNSVKVLRSLDAMQGELNPNGPRPFKRSAEALSGMLKERQLQDLSVLAVLECVRGDARKVWDLTELTQATKERFHLPFQGIYDRLKANP